MRITVSINLTWEFHLYRSLVQHPYCIEIRRIMVVVLFFPMFNGYDTPLTNVSGEPRLAHYDIRQTRDNRS